MNKKVSICNFKYDAPFAYSMTYDEGTVDTIANALPIHKKFGFPGHVDVVAGQLGKKRNCFLSSLNGFMHMSKDELSYLVGQGWGIGNHSWSHFVYPVSPGLDLYKEVVWSKYKLEDDLGMPVRIFTIPNDMYNYLPVIDLVKQHYKGLAVVDGGPNREGFDLYYIKNFMVSENTPYKRPSLPGWSEKLFTDNLELDFVRDSWLYETTHLVMHDVIQKNKCITEEGLIKRFEKITEISKGSVWAAKPDDVIDYELMKRNLFISDEYYEDGYLIFETSGKWPVGVINSYLTVKIEGFDQCDLKESDISIEFRQGPGSNLYRSFTGIEKVSGRKDAVITLQLTPYSRVKIRREV